MKVLLRLAGINPHKAYSVLLGQRTATGTPPSQNFRAPCLDWFYLNPATPLHE